MDDLYATLMGGIMKENAVPGVENLFEEGKPCEQWYSDMYEAYERLKHRLGDADEDKDVEMIINSLVLICGEVGEKMYHYGALFGSKE